MTTGINGLNPTMKRICVIDGQGGGIGATLIKYLKQAYGESVELIGLGTNAIATAQMLKACFDRWIKNGKRSGVQGSRFTGSG